MRIALYGGSFDPVHSGHVGVVRAALAELEPERVFVLPAALNPFKADRTIAGHLDARLRVRLLRLAFAGFERVTVDERELRRGGVSYAIDTVREFAAEYPGAEICFLIGEDSVAGLSRWKDFGELRRLCGFRSFPRTRESSTEVRRRLAAGEGLGDLVPEAVRRVLQP